MLTEKELKKESKLFEDVAKKMKGMATLAAINCG